MAAEEHGATKQAEGLRWIVDYTRAQGRTFGAVHVRSASRSRWPRRSRRTDASRRSHSRCCIGSTPSRPITASAVVALALLGGDDRALTFDEGRALVRPLLEYADARRHAHGRGRRGRQTRGRARRADDPAGSRGRGDGVHGTAPSRCTRSRRSKHVEAAFYRNNVVHHFVTRAIVELALLRAAEGEFADPAERGVGGGAAAPRPAQVRVLLPAQADVRRGGARRDAPILAPGLGAAAGGAEEIPACWRRAGAPRAPRVLGPFVEAYAVVADRLAARDPRSPVERGARS